MIKKEPTLSICIPTFNRGAELRKNFNIIERQILDNSLTDTVCVLISDNGSSDNTKEVLQFIKDNTKINVRIESQEYNKGGVFNVLFLLNIVETPWVMFLGDDDYLEPDYLVKCIDAINKYPNLGCIIANYRSYNPEKDELGEFREPNCETQYYKAGFEACKENAWRAHQTSGLTFRREGLYEAFTKHKLHNLYPQIFFVAYSALRYDVLHFGHFCLRVSDVPQTKKDWSYTPDFLTSDIFQNYKNLGLTSKQRGELELYFQNKQKRYMWGDSILQQNRAIEAILFGKNTSLVGTYYLTQQCLREKSYSGKKLFIWFWIVANVMFFKRLIKHEALGI